MILHIPHSSTALLEGLTIKDKDENLKLLTDLYTDELYDHDDAARVVFPYSRLMCDVERFKDKSKEVMEAKGMGMIYRKDVFGNDIHSDIPEEEIIALYDTHHEALTSLTGTHLSLHKFAFIVDCHSFPANVLPYEDNHERPDFCLGIDTFHTPKALTDQLIELFESHGYSVLIDKPFAGTIVPLKFYGTNENVKSIMIEVNRGLYLDTEFHKNEDFLKIKNIIIEALELIRKYEVSQR